MKRIALFAFLVIVGAENSHAQFNETVKDTVLKLLRYPTASYNISLSYKTEDYIETGNKPDLFKLSHQELKTN
jgi:hypothetical protein